ncbi:MAG: tetratricopeptide repeat protein [Bacteroidota bacterium]
MITHYNFFFNARERVKMGSQSLATAHEDKYDRTLSIFKYGDLNKAKSVFPDMDEAMKKVSIAISRNSMVLKGKKDNKTEERNKWIDDCYLIIGKAQFYKHDYWSSIETFQYISSEYKESEARPEALLWLCKSYLELGKTVDAEYLLDYLKNDKKFPVKLKGDYNAVVAQYHLMKEDVPRAIEALKKASATAIKKDDRARYTFILAQLLQKQDSLQEAFSNYQKVIKMNPVYEMSFNARINRARCYDVSSGSGELVKKELNKMLKDEKNDEYKDQIYYALAGIAQQEKQEDLAISLLNQSIRASTSNTSQLAQSYLALGNIFYKRPQYIPAAAYYDSCLSNLSNDHPDFIDIQSKKNSLERLVKNLKVIQQEDSLQLLSSLSPSEREEKIKSIIAFEDAEKERLKKEAEEKKKIEEQKVLEEKNLKSQTKDANGPGATAQGSWYFYNQSSISFGYNEFLKKWGTRKLEDNWRRSEKEVVVDNGDGDDTNSTDSTANNQSALNDSISKLDATARKNAYLAMIPGTPQAIQESNIKIAEAFYNCGVIYREQLSNFPESVKSFEELNRRFPDSKYKQPSYYNLYRTLMALGDSVKAATYKNYLLTNYPESEYAKLITNPNYYKELKKKTAVLEVYYENTYRAYLNKQFADVIERKEESDALFPNSKLAPKFSLLKAMAVGKTKTANEFELALEDVIRTYPKDSVATRAKEILDFMHGKNIKELPKDTSSTTSTLQNLIDSTTKFVFVPDIKQYYLVLYKNNALNTPDVINRIKGFNNVKYPNDKLEVKNGNIDLTYQYIMVTEFNTAKVAMDYYTDILKSPDVLGESDPSKVFYFVVSQDNLAQLARSKNISAYSLFFQKNYLQ